MSDVLQEDSSTVHAVLVYGKELESMEGATRLDIEGKVGDVKNSGIFLKRLVKCYEQIIWQ